MRISKINTVLKTRNKTDNGFGTPKWTKIITSPLVTRVRRFAAVRFITTYTEEWHHGHGKLNCNGVCEGGPGRFGINRRNGDASVASPPVLDLYFTLAINRFCAR